MEYDIGPEEAITTAVVRAVSAIEGRDPLSLRPIAEVLEPDAVDNIFRPRSEGSPRPGGRLSFVYSKSRVTIDNGEYMTIELIEPQPRTDYPSPPDGDGA